MIRTFAVLLCLSAAGLQAADSGATPAGRWRTFDDKTGKAKAIFVLYEEKGLLFIGAGVNGRECDCARGIEGWVASREVDNKSGFAIEANRH